MLNYSDSDNMICVKRPKSVADFKKSHQKAPYGTWISIYTVYNPWSNNPKSLQGLPYSITHQKKREKSLPLTAGTWSGSGGRPVGSCAGSPRSASRRAAGTGSGGTLQRDRKLTLLKTQCSSLKRNWPLTKHFVKLFFLYQAMTCNTIWFLFSQIVEVYCILSSLMSRK